MIKIIRNAEVYSPKHFGKRYVMCVGGAIGLIINKIDLEA